jgi:ABC-type uncharacterized transport system ATPase subunit
MIHVAFLEKLISDSAAEQCLLVIMYPMILPAVAILLIIYNDEYSFVTHYLNMYFSNNLKILVIGPEGSGKTTVTNFLCGKSNVLDVPYRPTAGVRIVETEKYIKNKTVTIELWDVSGSNVNTQDLISTIGVGQQFKREHMESSLYIIQIIPNLKMK